MEISLTAFFQYFSISIYHLITIFNCFQTPVLRTSQIPLFTETRRELFALLSLPICFQVICYTRMTRGLHFDLQILFRNIIYIGTINYVPACTKEKKKKNLLDGLTTSIPFRICSTFDIKFQNSQ